VESPDPVLVALSIAIAVAGIWVGLRLARGIGRFRGRQRARRGSQGERLAMRLLAKQGYRLVDTQVRAVSVVLVDGEPQEFEVRADAIVDKGRRRFVAECKTGQGGRVSNRSTRRQLLEYALTYDVDGVLLVDATQRTIVEVAFPALEQRAAMAARR